MKLLFDYCTTSSCNLMFILLTGAVLFIVSKVLDNSQSNSFEICIAGIGRILGFFFLLASITVSVFIGKDYTTREYGKYKAICVTKAEDALGGYDNINKLKAEVSTLNGGEIDIKNIKKTSETVNKIVIELNEEEMTMLAMGGIE